MVTLMVRIRQNLEINVPFWRRRRRTAFCLGPSLWIRLRIELDIRRRRRGWRRIVVSLVLWISDDFEVNMILRGW